MMIHNNLKVIPDYAFAETQLKSLWVYWNNGNLMLMSRSLFKYVGRYIIIEHYLQLYERRSPQL